MLSCRRIPFAIFVISATPFLGNSLIILLVISSLPGTFLALSLLMEMFSGVTKWWHLIRMVSRLSRILWVLVYFLLILVEQSSHQWNYWPYPDGSPLSHSGCVTAGLLSFYSSDVFSFSRCSLCWVVGVFLSISGSSVLWMLDVAWCCAC